MAKILGRIVFRASRNLRVSGINASSISPASLADRVAIKQGILWGCANRSSELYQGSAHTRHTFSSGATRLADDSSVSISGKANRNPEKEGRSRTLREGANKNPELYVLLFIMTGALTMVGFYFVRKPTSASSEQQVTMAPNSAPWESGTSGKYQYHPGGDKSQVKDAPSALHSVIIPNVNLPKHLHDQFNKYDKDEFDDY